MKIRFEFCSERYHQLTLLMETKNSTNIFCFLYGTMHQDSLSRRQMRQRRIIYLSSVCRSLGPPVSTNEVWDTRLWIRRPIALLFR